ncbi:SGNH/GDSL hydrolase family protein [Agromyces sp. NPDC055520]
MPLVAIQGRRARSEVEVLPEAAGPTTGRTAASDQPTLRLIVVGESTAAGCGAGTHDEAFTGSFARELGALHARPVDWAVHGRHGATIRRVRHRIIPGFDAYGDVDIAVLLIGVNDVLARTPVSQWRDDLVAVLGALADLAEHVVVAGIPPFDAFPSLPRPLRTYLAERGRALDAAAQVVCAADPAVSWMSSSGLANAEAEFFARDGFHPSPAGYQWWARDIANQLSNESGKR